MLFKSVLVTCRGLRTAGPTQELKVAYKKPVGRTVFPTFRTWSPHCFTPLGATNEQPQMVNEKLWFHQELPWPSVF